MSCWQLQRSTLPMKMATSPKGILQQELMLLCKEMLLCRYYLAEKVCYCEHFLVTVYKQILLLCTYCLANTCWYCWINFVTVLKMLLCIPSLLCTYCLAQILHCELLAIAKEHLTDQDGYVTKRDLAARIVVTVWKHVTV